MPSNVKLCTAAEMARTSSRPVNQNNARGGLPRESAVRTVGIGIIEVWLDSIPAHLQDRTWVEKRDLKQLCPKETTAIHQKRGGKPASR